MLAMRKVILGTVESRSREICGSLMNVSMQLLEMEKAVVKEADLEEYEKLKAELLEQKQELLQASAESMKVINELKEQIAELEKN